MTNPPSSDQPKMTGPGTLASTTLKLRAFERFPIAFVLTNPNIEDNPIVYVNRAFENLTGYSTDAAVGRNCRFLQGENTDDADTDYIREQVAAREPAECTLLNYRADGTSFYNRLRIEPIFDEDGTLTCFLGLQQRVDAVSPLPDKISTQLKEVQHRVKNHLQMIVSMIRLQSERVQDAAGENYQALAHRVETLQLLYQEMGDGAAASPLSTIPMGAYVSRIASAIGHLEGRENVRLNIRTEPFDVSVDTAARVGLVASEVITNAFQHAFADHRAGLVEVSLKHLSHGVMRLEVMDDGIGMTPGNQWPENTNSMGGSIVKTLVDGINAKLTVTQGITGTSVIIDIPFSGETNSEAN